MQYLCIQQLNK